MKKALLSIGSNMGDREGYLKFAVKSLSKLKGTRVTAVSDIYETAPVGGVEQGDFLNICVEIETEFSPAGLLRETQKIENGAGRTRDIRWGPRTLDVDIILYEGTECDLETLTIPHPRFTERGFVLRPMADIYPSLSALGFDFSRALDGAAGQRAERLGRLEWE